MVRTTAQEVAGHYNKMGIETAPKRKIIYLLHEKCVHLLNRSIYDTEKRRYLLDRAQNIIVQLQSALIREDTVAESLYQLYDYAYARLENGGETDIANVQAIMRQLTDTYYVLLVYR